MHQYRIRIAAKARTPLPQSSDNSFDSESRFSGRSEPVSAPAPPPPPVSGDNQSDDPPPDVLHGIETGAP